MTPDLPAPVDALARPDWLAADEIAAWDLHAGWVGMLKLESVVDGGSLLVMVRSYCRAIRADAVIETGGLSYSSETESGGTMIRPRPEISISRDSWRLYVSLAQQFGMTPAARAKFTDPTRKQMGAGEFPEDLGVPQKKRGA